MQDTMGEAVLFDTAGLDDLSMQALEFIEFRNDSAFKSVQSAQNRYDEAMLLFKTLDEESATCRGLMESAQSLCPDAFYCEMPLASFTAAMSTTNYDISCQSIAEMTGKMAVGVALAVVAAFVALVAVIRRFFSNILGRVERVRMKSKKVEGERRRLDDAYYKLDPNQRQTYAAEAKRIEEQLMATVRPAASPFFKNVLMGGSGNLDKLIGLLTASISAMDMQKLNQLLDKLNNTWVAHFKDGTIQSSGSVVANAEGINNFFNPILAEVKTIVAEVEAYRADVMGVMDKNCQEVAKLVGLKASRVAGFSSVANQLDEGRKETDPNEILREWSARKREYQLFIEPAKADGNLDNVQRTVNHHDSAAEKLTRNTTALEKRMQAMVSKPSGKDKKILNRVELAKQSIMNQVKLGIRQIRQIVAEGGAATRLLMAVLDEIDRNLTAADSEIAMRKQIIARVLRTTPSTQGWSPVVTATSLDEFEACLDELAVSYQSVMADTPEAQVELDHEYSRVCALQSLLGEIQVAGAVSTQGLITLQTYLPEEVAALEAAGEPLTVSTQGALDVIIKALFLVLGGLFTSLIAFILKFGLILKVFSSLKAVYRRLRTQIDYGLFTDKSFKDLYAANKEALDRLYLPVINPYIVRMYTGDVPKVIAFISGFDRALNKSALYTAVVTNRYLTPMSAIESLLATRNIADLDLRQFTAMADQLNDQITVMQSDVDAFNLMLQDPAHIGELIDIAVTQGVYARSGEGDTSRITNLAETYRTLVAMTGDAQVEAMVRATPLKKPLAIGSKLLIDPIELTLNVDRHINAIESAGRHLKNVKAELAKFHQRIMQHKSTDPSWDMGAMQQAANNFGTTLTTYNLMYNRVTVNISQSISLLKTFIEEDIRMKRLGQEESRIIRNNLDVVMTFEVGM